MGGAMRVVTSQVSPGAVPSRRTADEFVSGGEPPVGLRPEIAASWRRCRTSGVDPDTDLGNVPFNAEIDTESRLLRAARPVLDHLVNRLSGTRTSVILTDPAARILDRWVGEAVLRGKLDQVAAAPGAVYREEIVGTNGLGTAVEERRVVQIAGPEHFVEALRSFTCVGVPIHDPLTGHFEGVLDITCPYENTNGFLLSTITENARSIEQRLLEQASGRERELLDHFLRVARRSNRPVVTLNENVIISNSAAAGLLGPTDHGLLWELAVEALAGDHEVVGEVRLSGDREVSIRCGRIGEGRAAVGAIVEIGEHERDHPCPGTAGATPPPDYGLAGRGPAYTRLCAEVLEHAGHRLPLIVTGEAGAGKLAVAEAVHKCAVQAEPFAIVDAALLLAEGPTPWLRRVKSALGSPGGTLVVRHTEVLDRRTMLALCGLMDIQGEGRAPRLIATMTDEERSCEAAEVVAGLFVARIEVPPLRDRLEDIPCLVETFIRRHATEARVRCSPEVLQALTRLDWPGNIRQLENLVRGVLVRRHRGDVCLVDLPPAYLAAARRRRLTRIEQVERDAILATLRTAGNKVEAARLLGISRATLYRKIRTYGISPDRQAFS